MRPEAIKILLIEDNPGDARLIQEMLKEADAEKFFLVCEQSLNPALDKIKKDGVDLVLLDLGLPDSQGIDTFIKTQQNAPQLPIIVLTGLDDEKMALEAVRKGAQDYLVKGQVYGNLLAQAMIYAIERKRSEEKIRHLNLVLRAIRSVNQIITREKEPGRLINASCKSLVENRGYKFIWIALTDGSKKALVCAQAGLEKDFIPLQKSLKRGKFPYCAEKAITTSRIITIEDTVAECKDCPIVGKHAGGGALSLRLEHEGKTYGIMTASLPAYLVPDQQQQTLFHEVANDISFAIHNMELEKEGRQTAEALRKSKEFSKILLDSMKDGFSMLDTSGIHIDVNPAFCHMTGFSREELVGTGPPHPYWPEEEKKRIEETFQKTLRGQGEEFELLFKRKNGERFPVIVSPSNVTDDEGNIISYFATVKDITDRKRAEDEQLKTTKLESLSLLAGGIAHDFNNILTAILGNISFAKMEIKPGGELQEALLEAENAASRAKDLTQQLLTFAKGGTPIKKTASIENLIRETASFALRGSNVKCQFFIPDDLWPADVDEGQISQVINNLVINADQAMPGGGTLNISAENVVAGQKDDMPVKKGKYLKISVKDGGIGIQKEYISNIFEPYFTTKQRGSGLGLATCYSIIQKHEGYISAESEVGLGTTFHIWLPAAEGKKVEERLEEEKPLRGDGRILLMDDEEMIRYAGSRLIKSLGYKVDTADDGGRMINMYKRAMKSGKPFDAVIMDVTVPGGMGGREAIKKLKKIDTRVRAIVSSGYSNDPIMAEYQKYGFAGVVAKPYDIKQLSKVLHKVITEK